MVSTLKVTTLTTDDFRADDGGQQLAPERAWYRSPMLWSVVIVLTLISIPVAMEFQGRGVGEPRASDKGAASRPDGTQPARAQPVEEIVPPRAPPMTRSDPARPTIMKCIENGRVTYGDGACNGELVEVPIDTGNNVIKPDRQTLEYTARPRQPEPPPAPAATISRGAPPTRTSPTECQAIDAQIAAIDAQARQPQSAQTQDYLKDQRAKLRSRQNDLRC